MGTKTMAFTYAEKMCTSCVTHSVCLKLTMGLLHGRCYWNCRQVLETRDDYAGATYVEGIAVKPERSIHAHGWIEKDGKIIDPTRPKDDFRYFAALRFQGLDELEQAIKSIAKSPRYDDDLPIFRRFGWNGKNSPEFCEALKQALREFGETTPFDPDEEL